MMAGAGGAMRATGWRATAIRFQQFGEGPASCFLSRISGWRDRSLYPFSMAGSRIYGRAADSCLPLWGGGRRCWCAGSTAAPAVSYRAIVTEGRAPIPVCRYGVVADAAGVRDRRRRRR